MGWHELFLVEGDSVLPPGDQLLETKLCPMMPNEDASGWLAILDQLGPPNPRSIVAGHGLLGDGSLIGTESAIPTELPGRTFELKRQGEANGRCRTPSIGGV